jgi:hypothetical protein
MAQIRFNFSRSGDLSRESSIDWALEGSVLTGAPPLGTAVTPANMPYPPSQRWEQLTFPSATPFRYIESADQHVTSPYTDGSICDVACDRTVPASEYSTLQIVRIAGTFPGAPTFNNRAMFGPGAASRGGINNLKCHAVVVLPNDNVLLWYYRLNDTDGNSNSCCVLSTNGGVSFAALPAPGTIVFKEGQGEDVQPRGIIQPSPGYGAAGAPPDSEFDRNFFYLACNNQVQGSVENNRNRQGGIITLARYQFQGPGGSLAPANLLNRGRYSFYTGLDANGNRTWTPNGGLKTAAGVTPIFRNIVNGVNVGVGYFWQCHWHPRIQEWIATWTPGGNLDGVSIAHAPSLWDNSWQMLANNARIPSVAAAERGNFIGASAPAAWANATTLGIGLSTYIETLPQGVTDRGDDLVMIRSSPLVALPSQPSNIADLAPGQPLAGAVTWPANDATARSVVVNTVGNTRRQVNRVCSVRLSNPVNAVVGSGLATTTIVDDDA